jgi:hypothetical protein
VSRKRDRRRGHPSSSSSARPQPARSSSAPDDGRRLRAALDEYLETLELVPHQEVLAELARELAAQVVLEGTAAAADQLRRTLAELVPKNAKAHAQQSNADAIRSAVDQPEEPGGNT